MATATVGRWGDALAVRLPGDVVRASGLYDGQRVEIAALDDHIVIRPSEPADSAADWFSGATPEQWRAAYAGAYEWGNDQGREIVPE